MGYTGVIFDFNGTLFWDTELHVIAWKEFSKRLRGRAFSDEELCKYMVGKTNYEITKYCMQQEITPEFAAKTGGEKEEYYRQMCLENPEKTILAPGAEDFLDFLKENKVPMNIATMADRENVDFFTKTFNLEKWFDTTKIVCSCDGVKSKPDPEAFLLAAKNIGCKPEECVGFEDSPSGLEACRRANLGRIYMVKSTDKINKSISTEGIYKIITDYNQVERSLFMNS